MTWDDRGQLLMTGNANGEIRFWKEKQETDEVAWEEIRQKSKPIMLGPFYFTRESVISFFLGNGDR